ncbi:nucleolar protein 7-like isoform X3 [Dreissena polymorpha]|uniref:Uncharacterized protein n=1 Tax=Dreissena polymorpha TaxID=45954 RepID=A0A9D4R0T4_DREPO|nr:nucleolar protein 7-like isoform X1 [Dreissena polymorpha]XP_052274678.1 nucleolar protein 7-like isoform X2 [Dreissena polymorpha]XP_052274679.1 nucleolar protein 7-like isoform X3 [Dreissena polymorpha]KAH3849943.1 hypothetical protein DPMN_092347 [Dreissena polymorpha]
MKTRRRLGRIRQDEDGEAFETELFSDLNKDENPEKTPKPNHDDDSDEGNDAGQGELNSDDEAPDDVGFHDSKMSVLAELRSAMRQVDKGKSVKKEQRRKLDAQFKAQKAKKLEELSSKKLPDDFLATLDEAVISKPKVKKGEKRKKNKQQEEDSKEPDVAEPSPVKNSRVTFTEDFISLTDRVSGVEVAELKKSETDSRTLSQAAAAFRQSRLYGSHIPRESNKDRLGKAEKRKFNRK